MLYDGVVCILRRRPSRGSKRSERVYQPLRKRKEIIRESWHALYWIPEYTGTGPAGRAGLKFKSSQDRQVAHKRDSLLWYSLAVGNGASE